MQKVVNRDEYAVIPGEVFSKHESEEQIMKVKGTFDFILTPASHILHPILSKMTKER